MAPLRQVEQKSQENLPVGIRTGQRSAPSELALSEDKTLFVDFGPRLGNLDIHYIQALTAIYALSPASPGCWRRSVYIRSSGEITLLCSPSVVLRQLQRNSGSGRTSSPY
jgi:hypothetical protein